MSQMPRKVKIVRLIGCHMHVPQDVNAYLQLLQDRVIEADEQVEQTGCKVEIIWCDIQKVTSSVPLKDDVRFFNEYFFY